MFMPEFTITSVTGTALFAKEGLVSDATYWLTFLAILLVILKELAGIGKFVFHSYIEAVFAIDDFRSERERRQRLRSIEEERKDENSKR